MLGWVADGLYRSEDEIDNSRLAFWTAPKSWRYQSTEISTVTVLLSIRIRYSPDVPIHSGYFRAVWLSIGAWKGFDVRIPVHGSYKV
jgi:hypothetical protein